MLRFHTQTAGVQLTAQQPEVNLVRVTVQALGAVLGGTQSLHTNSYDEAIALPTEKAARLALRTQQVLAYETDLTATVDPFAGSYVVEAMTDEVEAAAAELMERVDDLGSARSTAIEAGFQKQRDRDVGVPDRAGDRQRRARRRRGQPVRRSTTEEPYEPLRVDPAIEAQQARAAGAAARRAGRGEVDPAPGRAAAAAAEGTENVLYPMKEALRARATVGRGLRRAARGLGHLPPRDRF